MNKIDSLSEAIFEEIIKIKDINSISFSNIPFRVEAKLPNGSTILADAARVEVDDESMHFVGYIFSPDEVNMILDNLNGMYHSLSPRIINYTSKFNEVKK